MQCLYMRLIVGFGRLRSCMDLNTIICCFLLCDDWMFLDVFGTGMEVEIHEVFFP